MLNKIYEKLEGKKVLLLGFGREGKASYRFIRKKLDMPLTIADKNPVDTKDLFNVDVISGEDYQKTLKSYDIIIKSPGIVLEDKSPEILEKVTSQTELFISVFNRQIVGITGTKGKSTTTTLIYHIIKSVHENTLLMGNIGIPAFDQADKIDGDTVIVYELSCHQLEYINVSPRISVFLNLFEEHLDHYGSFENYKKAKENIAKYQDEADILVCNELNIPEGVKSRVIKASFDGVSDVFAKDNSVYFKGEELKIPTDEIKLSGKHNLYNIGIAFAVCSEMGITKEEFISALKSYEPLPHRLQNIGTYDGIVFYNDSISTIGETAIQAIKSLKKVGTLLLGGMDRGVDYTLLADFLVDADVQNIVLMPDTSKRLFKLFEERNIKKNIVFAKDLKEAVEISKKITKKGEICLLSPAAASYGFFRDFEERGEYFVKYVKES